MAGTPDTPTNPPALSLLNRTLGEWKNVRGYLKQDLGTIQKWMNNVPRQPTHIDPRVVTVQSSAMPGIDTDTTDVYVLAQQATAILSFSASLQGNPVEGQLLTIRIFDNGTPQSITWGASFSSNGATLPTTTVVGVYLYVQCRYNAVLHVWECLAVGSGAPIVPAALTRTNDTNVTATLTGTPGSALLKAVNIALGWTGLLGLARGGTNADLSATGGASQYLKQVSSGAAITVGQPAATDLSDYVGPTSWTPIDASGAGLAFTSVVARYVKIGKFVMVSAQLVYPTTANTNSALIGGLPYTIEASGSNLYGCVPYISTLGTPVTIFPSAGTTTVFLVAPSNGGAYSNANMSTQQIRFTMTYIST